MNNFEEIFVEIKKHDSFYLSGHINPDGDSKGSCECLALALEQLGKNMKILPGNNFTFIQLDVQPEYRLPKDVLKIKRDAKTSICFDHHQVEDANCDFSYVDPEASACALIIWDFVKFMGVKITKEIATAAYYGLCSDTNSFRNSNTDERSLAAAAEMMSYGVDAAAVARELFQSRSLASFELEKIALERMVVDEELHYAFSFLTAEDYKKYNATKADSDALIDLLRELGFVEVACIIRQEEAGQKVRGSLRSKGNVDVTKLAKLHTGGGHKGAAGFTMDTTDMNKAIDIIKTQLVSLMSGKI